MKNYIVILFILMMIPSVSAYTLDSTTVSNTAIFKCQPSIITATFSDYGAITNVRLVLVNTGNLPMRYGVPQYANENIAMTYGAGVATYTYGNDATIIEGLKSISFLVSAGGVTTVSSGKTIRVYSDKCTGTNKQSYTNITTDSWTGGSNTKEFVSGKDPLSVILNYIVHNTIIGTIVISLIIFVLCVVIYLSTENIIHPLLVLFATLSLFTGTNVVPKEYGAIVNLIIVLALGGIILRIFKKY